MPITSTTRPAIRGRVLTRLPATLTATGGIAVEKTNGIWTISPDFSGIETIVASAVTDPAAKQLWIYDPVTEVYNVLTLSGLGDALYKLTSTTSLAIGTGSKVFTTQANKDISVGTFVFATSDADPTNYMLGQVTAYSGTSLTVNVTTIGGSGTLADWTIRASSPAGATGATGATGSTPAVQFNFSSSTGDADPGAGNFRLNNADPTLATEAYFDNTEIGATDVSDWLDSLDDGGDSSLRGLLKLFDVADPSIFYLYAVSGSVVDGTGYRKLTISYISGAGSLTNGLPVAVVFDGIGPSGGSPTDAQYVTLSTNGTLTDERVLTAGSGIILTDAGAGSTVTLATAPNSRLSNLGLALSVGSSALTIAIKDAAGNDPSASSPVVIDFRNVTAATGTPSAVSITGATSLVLSSGSTLGATSATAFRLWIVGFNDGGTFRIGAINCLSATDIFPLNAWGVASSTAEGGAGGADSAHVFYTDSGVTSKAYVILGYASWESGLSTAGTWDAVPTRLQLFGPGVPLPGNRLNYVETVTGAVATGTTQIPQDDSIPQNTEGDQYMTLAITPKSTASVLEIEINGLMTNSGAGNCAMALFQDSVADALSAVTNYVNTGGAIIENRIMHRMLSGTTSSTTFKMRAGPDSSLTLTFNGRSGGRIFGGIMNSYIRITELMT